VGLYTTTTIGQYLGTILNPSALRSWGVPDVPEVEGGAVSTILGASAGNGLVVFGTNTTLHYGATIDYHHGPKLKRYANPDDAAALAARGAAILYAGLAVADVFLPAASSDANRQTALGVLSPIATDLVLGIWAQAEAGGAAAKYLVPLAGCLVVGAAVAVIVPGVVAGVLGSLLGVVIGGIADLVVLTATDTGGEDGGGGQLCDSPYGVVAPAVSLVSAPSATDDGPFAPEENLLTLTPAGITLSCGETGHRYRQYLLIGLDVDGEKVIWRQSPSAEPSSLGVPQPRG
jgi:hypothetical protein